VTDHPDFATTPRPRRFLRWEATAVAIALLALAWAAHAAWTARAEAGAARAELSEVRREIDAARPRLRALEARSAAGVERRAQAAAAGLAPPSRIVDAVAAVLPSEARLERLSIDYGRGVSLEMQVVARQASAWDRLLDGLERAPEFADVEPGPEIREGELRTVLRARWVGR
jgi:hypothetical protein